MATNQKQKYDHTKLTSLHDESYGAWAGNKAGYKPDPSRCCKSVSSSGRSHLFTQCGRKRGYGPEAAYCKQHSPAAVAERRAKRDAEYEKDMIAFRRKVAGQSALNLLEQIADGHNDPRGAAQAFLIHHELRGDGE